MRPSGYCGNRSAIEGASSDSLDVVLPQTAATAKVEGQRAASVGLARYSPMGLRYRATSAAELSHGLRVDSFSGGRACRRHVHRHCLHTGRGSCPERPRPLRDQVVAEISDYEPDLPPALRADLEFMRTDSLLDRLLESTAQYTGGGRYFDVDRLLARAEANERENPYEVFASVELSLWDRAKEPERPDLERIHREMTGCLHRFARGLCRLFTLSPLAKRGAHLTAVLSPLLQLSDDALTIPTHPYWK